MADNGSLWVLCSCALQWLCFCHYHVNAVLQCRQSELRPAVATVVAVFFACFPSPPKKYSHSVLSAALYMFITVSGRYSETHGGIATDHPTAPQYVCSVQALNRCGCVPRSLAR
ncbi:hypothetical protein JZ751_022107 [Albula glossodonta]|uniref:Secreted protein n=1 Tax=Albula glossodonta TaxID=121402 RepID=A0A8T2NUG9_9TELE|nr:hypothetical protein JZ751_022107 [Albula glossodonta]